MSFRLIQSSTSFQRAFCGALILDTSRPSLIIAAEREAGAVCPHCTSEIAYGDRVASCPRCGTTQHWSCWNQHNGCGSYDCRPARVAPTNDADLLQITEFELQEVVPLAAPLAWREASAESLRQNTQKRWSKLAIASLVIGVLGIPLFGLVTGLIAVVVGCIALSCLRSDQRGLGLAVGGIVLGIADFVGWMVMMFVLSDVLPGIGGGGGGGGALEDFEPDPSALIELPEHIGRSMKSNVLIQVRAEKWNGLFGQGLGSGVILRITDREALIVTNRHVIDSAFADGKRGVDVVPRPDELLVKMVGQQSLAGEVVWIAPHGIDLALITAPVVAPDPMAAHWEKEPKMQIGHRVFAIGNPHGLGWTHTSGEISQMRKQDYGPMVMRIIQTTAAINPGNSGGGLYDDVGRLIGINTWTKDKRVAEGLNFAVVFQPLLTLAPAKFQLPENQQLQKQP